jgi:Flp pilus assembly protein TadG
MRLSDDRGLVGKVVLLGLVLAAIVVIAAIDVGSILLARSRAEDLADDASVSASQVYRETGDEEAAKLAALDAIAGADEPVRLKRIDVGHRTVTVVITTRADTLVVGSIPVFDDLARLTVIDSATVRRA